MKQIIVENPKGHKKKQTRPKTKSFGYQILGFGGGSVKPKFAVDYLVVAGGGGGGDDNASGGGAGGHRSSFPGGTQIEFESGTQYNVTVGDGGGQAGRGNDSVLNHFGANITSTAGGRGSRDNNTGQPGGSASGGGGGGGY